VYASKAAQYLLGG